MAASSRVGSCAGAKANQAETSLGAVAFTGRGAGQMKRFDFGPRAAIQLRARGIACRMRWIAAADRTTGRNAAKPRDRNARR